jgi:integrase/recombinase XerD
MGLGKQAKVLTKKQVEFIQSYLAKTRSPVRNQTIFLLSMKSGLRAKEIASLKWSMAINSDGMIADTLSLTNNASKGKSGGRVIPLHPEVKALLISLMDEQLSRSSMLDDDDENEIYNSFVIRTERSEKTSAQVIVNLFQSWYKDLGLIGCSSHSGRRTFITEAAKKVSSVGGSLRDVQALAGHSSLQTTQRYIEVDTEAQRNLINLL